MQINALVSFLYYTQETIPNLLQKKIPKLKAKLIAAYI